MTLKEFSDALVETRFNVTVFKNGRPVDSMEIDYRDNSKNADLLKYIDYKDAGVLVKWVCYNKATACIELTITVQ